MSYADTLGFYSGYGFPVGAAGSYLTYGYSGSGALGLI